MTLLYLKQRITKPTVYLPLILILLIVIGGIVFASTRIKQTSNGTANVFDTSSGQSPQIDNIDNTKPDEDVVTVENPSTTSGTATTGSSSTPKSNKTIIPDSTPASQIPATTPSEPQPETLSSLVAFYADSQSDTDSEDANHQNVVNNILSSGANPIFHAGDLMEDGTHSSLDRFNVVTSVLQSTRTFYSAQGNNERDSSLYFNNFSYPDNERWFSVNSGNLHMIILDNYASSVNVGSAQYNWLLSDLQSSASQNRLTGVIFHYPIYGIGGDYKNMITSMVPLFNNYGVDFVISGHEHSYQHSVVNSVNYYVCSGQPNIGYILAKVYSSYLTIVSYDANNAFIALYTIRQR